MAAAIAAPSTSSEDSAPHAHIQDIIFQEVANVRSERAVPLRSGHGIREKGSGGQPVRYF